MVILGFSEVRKENSTLKQSFEKKISAKLSSLDEIPVSDELKNFILELGKDLKDSKNYESIDFRKIWLSAKKWIKARQIVPASPTGLSSVIKALEKAEIIKSDIIRKGTQLKLLLTLKNDQKVIFKPKRYDRSYITDGIYSGADRHNGEIIECFYGHCYYCNENELVCPEEDGFLEGAIILMLPKQFHLQKLRHPWQRTYKETLKAQWEIDSQYCFTVLKSNPLQPRVLDFIDTSIFDFLIGNADRHHYEIFKTIPNSALLLIDNGKSFGDPHHDELTILFPLLQCCVIRNSTYQHLKALESYKISRIIEDLLSDDPLWPLLTIEHLEALDRRLRLIIASVEVCFDSHLKENVLKK
ncbi:glycosaminoglycan xylosylkinase-like protein [Sarcoptes scabiei]|uniref:Glycosaminoglycan xylosylkinase-like protein n=1 Tax=Sarcoptes scabiei TaxID=52283 RepID=A0A131ZX30_SARSC|nr:glycosaminoglycan xylosylkinase-like protein [Sarcoptes scabiei]